MDRSRHKPPEPASDTATERSGGTPRGLDALVDRIGSGPPLHELTVAQARAASLARRALLHRAREPVAVVRDIVLPAPDRAGGPAATAGGLRARLYAPREGAPAVLYLHGGGWVVGDLESADPICRSLAAASGCAFVSLDYPLAPEHPFPAAAEASYAAALWLAEGGDTIGVDASRIAVGGDSAGANLAAAVALMARDRGAPALRLQLLLFPPTDATLRETPTRPTPLLTRREMTWYWSHYLSRDEDASDPYASLLRADVSGLPPAILVTAEDDVLREEGDAYAAKLRGAGVPVRHHCHEGMVHGFFGLAGELPEAAEALRSLAREVRSALG